MQYSKQFKPRDYDEDNMDAMLLNSAANASPTLALKKGNQRPSPMIMTEDLDKNRLSLDMKSKNNIQTDFGNSGSPFKMQLNPTPQFNNNDNFSNYVTPSQLQNPVITPIDTRQSYGGQGGFTDVGNRYDNQGFGSAMNDLGIQNQNSRINVSNNQPSYPNKQTSYPTNQSQYPSKQTPYTQNQVPYPINNNNNNMNQFNTLGSNMGGVGGSAYQGNVDIILQNMARKILEQGQQVRAISDYFLPYDAYDGRTLEAWELDIIFQGSIQNGEAQTIVQHYSHSQSDPSVPIQILINALSPLLGHLSTGKFYQQGSVFIQKAYQLSPPSKNYLVQINNFFLQMHLSLKQGYDQYFHQSYVNENDFQNFMQQMGINLSPHDNSVKELFNYFKVQNEFMLSPIGFVQGMKQVSTLQLGGGIGGVGGLGGISNNRVGSPEVIDRLVSELQALTSRGMSFEQILAQFRIPNITYHDSNQITALCQSLNIHLTPQQKLDLIASLDQDRCGKAKLSYLRQKVENAHSYNSPPSTSINNQQTMLPSSMGGLQPKGNSQNSINKIKSWLKQAGILDLKRFFESCYYDGKVVVELQQFLTFLESPEINLNQKDSFELAGKYILDEMAGTTTTYYVDLEAFEADISDGPSLGMELRNSFISLNQVYDELRKYVMMTNGDIYQFFSQFDLDHDNLISKVELSNLLNKLGFTNASQSDLNNIFNFFDDNKDGRVSVQELCNKFADLSNVEAIKDPSHWAFFIFDSIRRISMTNSTSLSQLFGINQFHIQTLKDQVFISKDQFFSTLRRFQIPVNPSYEQPLLDLLKADMRNNYQINFIHLQGLVGLNQVTPKMDQFNQERMKQPFELQFQTKYKLFYQSLYEAMQSRNIQPNYLGMLFKSADPQNQGLITLQDFQQKLQSIDFERKIDARNLAEIVKKFSKQQGNAQLIDYRYFLGNLEVEVAKYKLVTYMFETLDQAVKQAKAQNLGQLFQKLDRSGSQNFTKQMLQSTLTQIGLYLKPEELELILIEYDSQGQNHGQSLDFKAFNADFEQFINGKTQLNQFSLKKNESYNQFFTKTKEFNIDLKNIKYNKNSIMETNMSPGRREQFKNLKQPQQQQYGGQKEFIQTKEPSIGTMRLWTQIGIEMEQNPKVAPSLLSLLHENDVQKTGQVSPQNFSQILEHVFRINIKDQQELVTHYTTLSQKNIIIYQFLEHISEYVQDMRIKTSLAVAVQDFKTLYSQVNLGGIVQEQSLTKYQAQFEEIYKSIVAHGSDTYKYFESLSHSKQTLSKQEFSAGLLNLNLKSATANDINEIYNALDQRQMGYIDIFIVDQAIRQTVTKSGIELTNHILEQILQAYNGDDAFIFQQLNDMDRMKRGKVSELDFVNYFMKNAPQYVDFSENDLHFLAQHYMNQKISKTDVDYNGFHTDLTRIKSQMGIHGNPQYHGGTDMKDYYNAGGNKGGQTNYNVQGNNNNPLLPSYSKNNTRTLGNKSARAPIGFRLNVDPKFIEDLMKYTYMKGKLVEDYFSPYAIPGQNMINESQFGKAIMGLGLDWTLNQCSTVFHEIDRAFNKQQTKLAISAEQIDQSVHFSTQKTIEDLYNAILQQIAQHTSQSGINIRGEIQYYDYNQSKLMTVDNLKDLILNRLLSKDLSPQDIVFLSMKYIQSQPNMVHYEKFIEDLEVIFRSKYSHNADFKGICDYIRKACISKQFPSFEEYIKRFMKQSKDQINFAEFQTALSQLDIVPTICSVQQLGTLFSEIDMSHLGKVTVPQVQNYLNKVASTRQTKEYQEEIIANLITTVKSRNILIDNIFKQEDPMGKSIVPYDVFERKMMSQFYLKQIDARLLALKYLDTKNNILNYRNFLLDYHLIEKNSAIGQVHSFEQQHTMTVPDLKLKQLLLRIGDQTLQKNIQLSKEFQQHEKGSASVNLQQTVFFAALKAVGILLGTVDVTALTQFYGNKDNSINHRKFLEDLKLYGTNRKPIEALTLDQRNLYKALGDYLRKHNLQAALVQGFLNKDQRTKGHLDQYAIQEVFSEQQLTVSKTQFDTMFGTLDKNTNQELNYKQLVEYLLGVDEANKHYTQAVAVKNKTVPSAGDEILYKFVMPAKPINPLNIDLGEIGQKVIHSNVNIEEEFKKRIGNYQQTSMQVIKVSENDIIQVLKNCHVDLNQDEFIQLQAYIIHNKDGQNQKGEGLIYLIQFLTAIGLPPQTIGLAQALPKKILNQSELTMARNMIISLRTELTKMQKRPQDVFDKYKKSIKQPSLKQQQFKMAILGECGQFGKTVTDEQINLLTYYLQEDTQGEISYNKLYLAFTSTDKDPPLKQYGTENIKKYEDNIKRQFTQGLVPLEVIDLIHHMKQSNQSITSLFKVGKGQVSRQDFETLLKQSGFVHKNMPALMDHLALQGSKTGISLDKLSQFIAKVNPSGRVEGSQITSQMARDLYTKFDPKVRTQLQKISDYLKKEGVTLQRLYQQMDANQDGTVDKKEFVTGISTLSIPGVFPSDLGLIFDAIDINNDGYLSINEFGLFLEGAKASRMQRLQDLDHKQVNDMIKEIETLFKSFDENGDGYVTGEEIYKSLRALGQKVTLQDANDLIQTVDTNGDGRLELKEFTAIMLPKMKEDMMRQEDNIEELRSMFLEADIDHSGTLSIDELYSAILKMGAEVTMEELIEMMNEIDVDRNGALDIDEFVAMMNMGEEIQFRSNGAKNTFLNIKKVRKLNPMDFFNLFKNMPMNFIPSFYQEAWVKMRKNLPASVFVPQLDPKTMLYKDLMPLLSENIPPTQAAKAFQPRLRPIKLAIGSQILLDLAEGIPIPQNGQGFNRSQIVKRAVRIGLYDSAKKEFILNAVQVNAIYNQSDEDIWKFNEWKENGMNPVLFKTDSKETYCKGTVFLIFELVIYVQFDKKVTEMSCGWCQLNTNLLERQITHKLPIKGGSPNAEMVIKGEDVHTKRTGINYIMKVVQTKISSQLQVSIRPQTKFTEETKVHLDLLPSTCLIQKRLLYFVSGFRNYVGEKLLKESSMGTFKHPEGDVIISTFPKILNNPDICESLIKIWSEDFWSTIKDKQKLNIEHIMLKTKDYIQRLYPVLYSDEFQYHESNPVESAAGNQYLVRKREELIQAALRYGQQGLKVKVNQPVEALTTFKPFTVRELEYEIWDTQKAKQEQFLKQYDEIGLLTHSKSTMDQMNMGGIGGGSNFNQRQLGGAQASMQQPLQQQQQPFSPQMQGRPNDLMSALNQTKW